MNLVDAQNLTKAYASGAGELMALDAVNFSVRAGEFVAIMGPSGSGKTTLMNLVGLLDRPSGGRLMLEGEDVTGLSPDRQAGVRNARIGFIFQSYNLLPRSSAIENVELPLIYAGMPRRERRELARRFLSIIGLSGRMDHLPAMLSGGEQQRVAIARAVVNNPALILADEPTGALDSTTGRTVLAIFQKLNTLGKSVLMVTHDEAVARHASRILRIQDGRIVSDAPVENRLFARDAQQEAAGAAS